MTMRKADHRTLRATATAMGLAGAAALAAAHAIAAPPSLRQHAGLIAFDAPGAATVTAPACGTQCGTLAIANNDLGEIVGVYTDANVVPHGFIRRPDGKITSFDAPGAGLGAGLDEGTFPYGINDFGVIAGQFEDTAMLYHGFIRKLDGTFKTIDVPAAGTGANQGTLIEDINNAGAVGGYYVDAGNTLHGFVADHAGITTFDPPGSVYTFPCQETCLADDGALVGIYLDASNTVHGFLRTRRGAITSFDAPGASAGQGTGTIAASINARHEITGYFLDTTFAVHGFLRSAAGNISVFDVPGSNVAGTVGYSINLTGVVAGATLDTNSAFHGFSRARNGKVVSFDAPGAGTGMFQGTRPSTNNLAGEVTGWWIDPAGLNHGFVWTEGR